jgi:mono/diheme cytochrome c family protein
VARGNRQMKRYRRIIDGGLLLLGVAVLILLLMAPPASTPELPADAIHGKLAEAAASQGKKTAENHCASCHNPADMPLPEDHPAGYRCLFCHHLPAR